MAGQPGRLRPPDNRKRAMIDLLGSIGLRRGLLLAAGCLAAAIAFGLALPHAAAAQALSHAQRQALNGELATQFGYYLGAAEDRHAAGKTYCDLSQRFANT